jgi:Protein of unknown function (DUF3489)
VIDIKGRFEDAIEIGHDASHGPVFMLTAGHGRGKALRRAWLTLRGISISLSKAKPGCARCVSRKRPRTRIAEGASIEEMMQATEWQQHSVRGFLAGTVKSLTTSKAAGDETRRGR